MNLMSVSKSILTLGSLSLFWQGCGPVSPRSMLSSSAELESAASVPEESIERFQQQLEGNDQLIEAAMQKYLGIGIADYDNAQSEIASLVEDLNANQATLDGLVKVYEANALDTADQLSYLASLEQALTPKQVEMQEYLAGMIGPQRFKVENTKAQLLEVETLLGEFQTIVEYLEVYRPKLLEKIQGLGG